MSVFRLDEIISLLLRCLKIWFLWTDTPQTEVPQLSASGSSRWDKRNPVKYCENASVKSRFQTSHRSDSLGLWPFMFKAKTIPFILPLILQKFLLIQQNFFPDVWQYYVSLFPFRDCDSSSDSYHASIIVMHPHASAIKTLRGERLSLRLGDRNAVSEISRFELTDSVI